VYPVKHVTKEKKAGNGVPLSGFCPRFHRAVELVGKRWTGAVIRSLLGGKRRFNEIAELVPGISDRLLAERLRELEETGIVRRDVECGPPVRVSYTLTEAGTELDGTMRALATWAERWMPATPKSKRASKVNGRRSVDR
jgi:DNA-binding HxlR family transcriptional regulator